MPMTTAVIGSLIASTVIGLFVVSGVLTFVDDLTEKRKDPRRSNSEVGLEAADIFQIEVPFYRVFDVGDGFLRFSEVYQFRYDRLVRLGREECFD
jgi:hypothetical protein